MGLVDQGSQGGGGKIWQRGGPSGGGGIGSGGGGSGVDGSDGGVDSGGGRPGSASLVGLLGGSGGDEMDLCRYTHFFGNIWLLFGILFSVCVFVGIPKKRQILFGLLFVLQIK